VLADLADDLLGGELARGRRQPGLLRGLEGLQDRPCLGWFHVGERFAQPRLLFIGESLQELHPVVLVQASEQIDRLVGPREGQERNLDLLVEVSEHLPAHFRLEDVEDLALLLW